MLFFSKATISNPSFDSNMRYTLVAPAILAVTVIAAPVPQDDLIDTLGAAVNVGGDETVGVSKACHRECH